jgi:hypothetical protein
MLKKLLRPERPVFALPDPLASAAPEDRREIGKCYARLFATEDGKRVLAHLHGLTLARSHAADAPEAQLRHAEGQRALMLTILRFIGAGRAL